MSYTEIYCFNKKGESEHIGETKNAFAGAMAIWTYLEEKYLPPFVPKWADDDSKRYYRCHQPTMGDNSHIREVWNLSESDGLSFDEKTVLFSTFDNVVVRIENIDLVLKAFDNFEGFSTLKEQAKVIREAMQDSDDIIAIAWNQTSVGEFWGYDYNLLNHEKQIHWFMFNNTKE